MAAGGSSEGTTAAMLKTDINAERSNSLELTVSELEDCVCLVGLTGAAYCQGMSYRPVETRRQHTRYCAAVSQNKNKCFAMSGYASKESATRSGNKKSPLKQQSRSFRRVEGDMKHDSHARPAWEDEAA